MAYHSDVKVVLSHGAFYGTPTQRVQHQFDCPSLPAGSPLLGHSGLSCLSEESQQEARFGLNEEPLGNFTYVVINGLHSCKVNALHSLIGL